MTSDSQYKFEQGPIRPPSESESLLIRITRNCSWNRCTFCPVYKGKKFSIRPLEHVLKDIEIVSYYVKKIISKLKEETFIPSEKNNKILDIMDPEKSEAFYAALNFVSNGMQSIFLQDGNSLIIKPSNIITILSHIKRNFPKVTRITTYARSHTVAKISYKNLALIAAAGLNRIHIGMESGSNKVLKIVNKGVDKSTQILAGQKVKQAGIQLSEYYMPGLGGKTLTEENAIETADALNQINPDFIRLRTLAVRKITPLDKHLENGFFEKMGEIDTVREILTFVENLDNINSTVLSDHVLNLLTEVNGILPGDKEDIINDINKFLNLNLEQKMVFCVGKRLNDIRKLTDLDNPEKYNKSLKICNQLGITLENMDKVIEAAIQNFL